jgi:hypothetical protein
LLASQVKVGIEPAFKGPVKWRICSQKIQGERIDGAVYVPGTIGRLPGTVHAEGAGGGRCKAKRLDFGFFRGEGQGCVLPLPPIAQPLAGEMGLAERTLPDGVIEIPLKGKTGCKLAALTFELEAVIVQRTPELQPGQVHGDATKLDALCPDRSVEEAIAR